MYSTIKSEFIKIEPLSDNEAVSGANFKSEFIKIEPFCEESKSCSSDRIGVKQEPVDGKHGAEEAQHVGLYTNHTFKEELVIGPEVMQQTILPEVTLIISEEVKKESERNQPRRRRILVPIAGSSSSDPLNSPVKKRKPTTLTVGDRTIVINAFKYVKNTWPEDRYRSNPEMVKTTSDMTGVSKRTIYGILKEYIETNTVEPKGIKKTQLNIVQKLDDSDKTAIRQKVHSFFIQGELPTLDKILQKVNEDSALPNLSKTSLRRVLKHLKFKFLKNRKGMLIDHPTIVMSRIKYLREIQKYRNENRNIYYLHETCLNTGLSTSAKNPTEQGNRLIVVHVGNEHGFLKDCQWVFESNKTGDYRESLDAPHFEKWFAKVLSKLKENDVIIMDNASHHCRRLENIPTMAWKKQNIIDWLRSKNVDAEQQDIKAYLMRKVKLIKHEYQSYVTDELANQKGVTILRWPPYHCELNPIELVWAEVKDYIARHNSNKLSDFRNLLTEALTQVTPDKWRVCVERVVVEETKMNRLDYQIDKTVDSFLLNVTDSLQDESSTSESSDTDVELSCF